MFTIDNTLIDVEVGQEAAKVLFEELGEDFLKSYKKIRRIIMQKRIGQDYLLSRKVSCSHPKFMEKYPNVDDDTFSLLATDLVIRGEAIVFMLKKQMGVDVMNRYNEIKQSINKRKLKNRSNNDDRSNYGIDKDKSGIEIHSFWPFVRSSIMKTLERLMYGIKYMRNMIFNKLL